MDRQMAITMVKEWLDINKKHLAAHERGAGSYCYMNENGYNYSDHMSSQVSVEEAFEEGWFFITPQGVECCCQHQIPILPEVFDPQVIKERIIRAVREEEDFPKLLKIAGLLHVSLVPTLKVSHMDMDQRYAHLGEPIPEHRRIGSREQTALQADYERYYAQEVREHG